MGAHHERVTVRRPPPPRQTVDEATLDALYADRELAPLLGRRATPRSPS